MDEQQWDDLQGLFNAFESSLCIPNVQSGNSTVNMKLTSKDSGQVIYRPMRASEADNVCEMVNRVFDETIAPHYNEEGILAFRSYTHPAALKIRMEKGLVMQIALAERAIVGVVGYNCRTAHLHMLFVDQSVKSKGIGKELLRLAKEACARQNDLAQVMSVHSAPNAVSFYEKLGFVATGIQTENEGMIYLPMEIGIRSA